MVVSTQFGARPGRGESGSAAPAPSTIPAPSRRARPRLALRVWHRLLAAGTGSDAALRGWDRVLTWRQHATAADRRAAVARFLKLPLRAARLASEDVARFGADVAARWGVPRRTQLVQLWWLRVRYGLSGAAYLLFQLYRPERRRLASVYVQIGVFHRVVRFLNGQLAPADSRILIDKRRFEAWCGQHDFPTVPTLAQFDAGHVTGVAAGDALPAADLFTKSATRSGGYDAVRWRYDGAGGYAGADGRARSPTELVEELCARSLEQPMVLQVCLRNHHALTALTAGGLCTVRMQTYHDEQDEVRLLLGVYKMPVGDTAADNFHCGGVAAPVELATGRLGRAVYRPAKLYGEIERQPTTGAVIEGTQLPDWPDAVELVLAAHRALPTVPVIGWDVALVEQGPILVEGNSRPGADIAQFVSGVPLGATPLVRSLNARLSACLA